MSSLIFNKYYANPTHVYWVRHFADQAPKRLYIPCPSWPKPDMRKSKPTESTVRPGAELSAGPIDFKLSSPSGTDSGPWGRLHPDAQFGGRWTGLRSDLRAEVSCSNWRWNYTCAYGLNYCLIHDRTEWNWTKINIQNRLEYKGHHCRALKAEYSLKPKWILKSNFLICSTTSKQPQTAWGESISSIRKLIKERQAASKTAEIGRERGLIVCRLVTGPSDCKLSWSEDTVVLNTQSAARYRG